jgi:hypothetical protein
MIPMSNVSILRLYLLRAMYAFMVVGLAITRWPQLLDRSRDLSHMDFVVASVLGAISLLALLGIRYPTRMLPLLMFELLWKVIWVALWGLPRWIAEDLDAAGEEILINCLVGIALVPLVIPWGYVFDRYWRAPGDPWRTPTHRAAPGHQSAAPAHAANDPR